MALLEVRNLTVEFPTGRGRFKAVDGVDLTVDEGELVGVVGESGSGKSVSMLAAMGLIGFPGQVRADIMRFGEIDLLGLSARQRRRVLGKDMAMIFQEPLTSLNPCFTIGFQIMEMLAVHEGGTKGRAPAPHHRTARPGRHSCTGEAALVVSAPDVGGHEPAGHDRHGDRMQSEAALC